MYCDSCGATLSPAACFCPGCGKAIAVPSISPTGGRVGRHVQLLGILWLAYGALQLLGGIVVWLVSRFILEPLTIHSRVPVFVPMLLVGVAAFILLMAAVACAVGWGLLQREGWARILAIVLAFLELLNIPLGTALGIYTLWVLLPAQAAREYQEMTKAS